jgi:hypothetical protein
MYIYIYTCVTLSEKVDIIVLVLWKLGEPADDESKRIHSCNNMQFPVTKHILLKLFKQ